MGSVHEFWKDKHNYPIKDTDVYICDKDKTLLIHPYSEKDRDSFPANIPCWKCGRMLEHQLDWQVEMISLKPRMRELRGMIAEARKEDIVHLVEDACQKRGEIFSAFVRKAILLELGRLGFLSDSEEKALGLE